METVEVALGKRSYRIVVGRRLLAEAGRHVAAVLAPRPALIVTDSIVAQRYLPAVRDSLVAAGFAVGTITVPPGEASKCHEQLLRIYQACYDARLERSSLLVALGGGVIGDLAGFAAASYLRGLPFVQMPTTLLSQVDSSIGGKTGVNLPGGKNLVGAFHQPSLVLADVDVLASLDDRQMATGLAEIVKHAVIRDAGLFARLERDADALWRRDPALLESVVACNCRIKAEVVAADEHEGGLRAILNYGHTVGHAIEQAAGYGQYTHGEAVALGMIAEAELARGRGLLTAADADRQRKLIERFGLPTQLGAPLPAETLTAAMLRDKKVQSGRVRFVLPAGLGRVDIVSDVREGELRAALNLLQP